MHVRGHTLVWHNQTPAWVFNDANGNPMTPTPENRALLIQRMQNHIQAVMTHFGNDVPIWDVVNEPIDQSQPDGYRRSPWFNIIGPEYIEIALQAARAASPTAKLYINDFDTTEPGQARFAARPGARPQEPRRAARRRRPPDAQQHRVPAGADGHRRRSTLFATTGRRAVGHRAGRQHLQRLVPDARSPATPTSRPAATTQVGYSYLGLPPGLQAAAGEDRVAHDLGDVGRQVVADVVDARSTRRCCSTRR